MNSCFDCKHFQYEYLGYDEEGESEIMGCDKDQDTEGLNFNGKCEFFEEKAE